MKLVRSLFLSLTVLGGASFVVACGGSVEHSPQTSAAAATKAPIGTNTHGFVKVVGDALGEVALRPEQRTEIEKLAQDAEARHAPMFEGRKELMLAFADQIERGTIDKAALQPKIDRVIGRAVEPLEDGAEGLGDVVEAVAECTPIAERRPRLPREVPTAHRRSQRIIT